MDVMSNDFEEEETDEIFLALKRSFSQQSVGPIPEERSEASVLIDSDLSEDMAALLKQKRECYRNSLFNTKVSLEKKGSELNTEEGRNVSVERWLSQRVVSGTVLQEHFYSIQQQQTPKKNSQVRDQLEIVLAKKTKWKSPASNKQIMLYRTKEFECLAYVRNKEGRYRLTPPTDTWFLRFHNVTPLLG